LKLVLFVLAMAYTEYSDPRGDYWQKAVVPALRQISLKAWQRDTGKSVSRKIGPAFRSCPFSRHCPPAARQGVRLRAR
jgi:hypothetical protein